MYKKVLDDGFIYRFTFPVKKPGAFQYRVAVRDEKSEKVGSASQFVEVPDIRKGKLNVSSLVIETLTESEWQKLSDPNGGPVKTDPQTDTALRRIKLGSIIHYGFEIYNAKLDPSKKLDLKVSIRIFRDGKIVLDGRPATVDLGAQTDPLRVKYSGAFTIGSKLVTGDYILQAIVTDRLAKSKEQIATQYVQFEVIE
jgi:hypothetical protein